MKSIYSLKGRILFKEVYLKGRKIQGTGIRVYTLRSIYSNNAKPDNGSNVLQGKKNIKIAIALTKSFGEAHIRNKAKRRIRAICTGLFSELKDGFCIIVRIDSGNVNCLVSSFHLLKYNLGSMGKCTIDLVWFTYEQSTEGRDSAKLKSEDSQKNCLTSNLPEA